jgi:hypothetical protein
MGLSDPFSTTYEGTRQSLGTIGAGIQQSATQFAERKQKEVEAQRALGMGKELKVFESDLETKKTADKLSQMMPILKQLGIYEDREVPTTIDDIKNHATQFGVNIDVGKNMTDDKQISTAKRLAEAMGIPIKPKVESVINPEAAAKAGFSMDEKGIKIAPKEDDKLKPSIQRLKNMDTTKLIQTVRRNEKTNIRAQEVLDDLDKIPTGALGSANIKYLNLIGSKDPILGKWQKMKSLLSDIQLGKLQFTKGAISDREMEWFARAVANDDISSYPRIKETLTRAMDENITEGESLKAAYQKNYDEDPDELLSSESVNKPTGTNVKEIAPGYSSDEWEVVPSGK